MSIGLFCKEMSFSSSKRSFIDKNYLLFVIAVIAVFGAVIVVVVFLCY